MSDLIDELRALLRECIPSLQRDGRPHIVTLVQAALGDIVLATDEPYCTCPDDYMAGVHHPDCISQKDDSTTDQPVAIPLTSAEIAEVKP